MYGLDEHELNTLKKLDTPPKIQDFLNSLSVRWKVGRYICLSPRRVLRERSARCAEGAILAALALRIHGHKPLIVDITTAKEDSDHVVAVFKVKGRWGALSKTNHAVLRYREPVYKSIRELAMSYFHEYFLDNGKKTMLSYSLPLDLSRFDSKGWATDEKDIWYIPGYLDSVPHFPVAPIGTLRHTRKAEPIEIAAGKLMEWSRKNRKLKF